MTESMTVNQQARHWVVRLHDKNDARLHDESDSTAVQHEFEQWRNADPEHARAYEAARRAWEAVGQLEHLRGTVSVDDLEEFRVDHAVSDRASSARWFWRPLPLGAALVAVVVAALAVMMFDPFAPAPQEYRSAVAEMREVRLDDGSEITLGAKTAIAVEYSNHERRVTLREGEAFFDVYHDPDRPFLVYAGETSVRVVGTRFEVSRGVRVVRTAVVDGAVEVGQNVLLTAGQQVVAEADAGVGEVHEIDPNAVAAWREGRLYYEDASLVEVVGDANRYFDGYIRIADEEIESLRITGSFRTDGIDQMVADLGEILPVQVLQTAPGHIVLMPQS